MASIVLYGNAKSRFAEALGLGSTAFADPRVLDLSNRAQEAIMRELAGANPADGKPWTPRGVFVGGVDVVSVIVASDNTITLDAAHDVALQVDLSTAEDINNGWYSELDMAGCVDPDFANDAVFFPVGYDNNGNRIYKVPTANPNDTVKVSAKKRFVALAGLDTNPLLVSNVEAVCDMIICLQKRQGRDNPDGANAYFLKSLCGMKAELDGYLADPTHTLPRKASYLADEKTYAPNTLGYVRARLALDVTGLLKVGKTQVTRAVNRAVEWLVQRTNELRTTGRLSVKTGLANLTFVPAVNAADVLTISDYEQIRTLVSGATAGGDAFVMAEQRALSLLTGQVTNALETLRHQNYAAALQTLLNAGTTNTLGYVAYTLALEPENPNGLKLSDVEWFAKVNKAVFEAIQHRNALSATELYSNVDGPDILVPVWRVNPSDVLPYDEYDVLRMLVMAQDAGDQAPALKAQAFALIEENLAKAVKATRNAEWHCLLSLPLYTFGRVRGQIGLGLSEQGFDLSDQKLGRMINEAEESICYTPNFVGGEGEYQLGCVNSIVEMPDDVERVIYADICGQPLHINHRSFEYLGWPQGRGVQGNCRYENGFWYWGYGNSLQAKGLSDDGNRQYFVNSCLNGSLRVIIKRRWMPKKKDSDVMLVQNLDAIRLMIESKLAREAKDLASADALAGASERALDRQLENHVGSENIVPKFNFLGGRRSQGRQLLRRCW